MTMVHDTDYINVDLVVELLDIDTLMWNRPNVSSNIVTSDVDSILKNKSHAEDGDSDMLGEEDETLEVYIEKEVFESEEDDDINDGGDIQDISNDDE